MQDREVIRFDDVKRVIVKEADRWAGASYQCLGLFNVFFGCFLGRVDCRVDASWMGGI